MDPAELLSYGSHWRWLHLARRNEGLLRVAMTAWDTSVLAHLSCGDRSGGTASFSEAHVRYKTARSLQLVAEHDLIGFIKTSLPEDEQLAPIT
jgi:hypothetical protein